MVVNTTAVKSAILPALPTNPMYKRFFDLRERPFKLVPNPAYLFLSKGHEEALAHLSYALAEGDGFVAIIGEVGTGKTLLCRTFLDSLDEEVEAAYVFNPRLDGRELLRAINDELGVDATGETTKELIDALNHFLIAQHQTGRRVLLLIDEAQNLSAEVLEQLRLLSNLETRDAKLLQIILVGQPELAELLDSHELRQLAQRITLSCYLAPLDRRESGRYIAHRLAVASQGRPVSFSRGALRVIHRFSGGVPRLMNIACDRALLAAYVAGRRRVSGRVARQAVVELRDGGHGRRPSGWAAVARVAAVVAVAVVAAVAVARYPTMRMRTPPPSATDTASPAGGADVATVQPPPSVAVSTNPAPSPAEAAAGTVVTDEADTRPALSDILRATTPRASRVAALRAALSAWGVPAAAASIFGTEPDDTIFFRGAATASGLELRRVDADLALLAHLDLPAILELRLPDNPLPRYLTLVRVDGEVLTLRADGLGGGEAEVAVAPEALNWYWTGTAYLPWRDFVGIGATVPLTGGGKAVHKVKRLLAAAGLPAPADTGRYDDHTRTLIEQIQASHGLQADGVVGALTKICLYNESPGLHIPHLIMSTEEAP